MSITYTDTLSVVFCLSTLFYLQLRRSFCSILGYSICQRDRNLLLPGVIFTFKSEKDVDTCTALVLPTLSL